jgi:transmembrane sensor
VPTDGTLAPPTLETIEVATIRDALGWQAPRLVFVDTPLSEVVTQFNRRNHLQLVLGDDTLASRAIGGNFRADNVETFVRMLESTREILVESRDRDRIVLRKAR